MPLPPGSTIGVARCVIPGEPAEAHAQSHEKVSEPDKPNGGRYQRQLARRGQPPPGNDGFGGEGRERRPQPGRAIPGVAR